MLPEYIVYLAVIIQLCGVAYYIKGMVYGVTKPNLVSWVVWALAPFIAVWLQLKAGAGLAVLPVFMAGFNPVLVILTAIIIKKGYWKITTFDLFCGLFSLLALLFWILTKNLSISVLFAILSDGLASLPTIKKAWLYPETETSMAYTAGLSANVIGLLIIKNWIFPVYFSGVYFIIINIIIIFAIYRRKILKFI